MQSVRAIALLFLAVCGFAHGEEVKAPEGIIESVLVNAAQIPRPSEALHAVASLLFPPDGPAAAFLGSMRNQLATHAGDFATGAEVVAAQRQLEEAAVVPEIVDSHSYGESAGNAPSVNSETESGAAFQGRPSLLRGGDPGAPHRQAYHHYGHHYGHYGHHSPGYYGGGSYYSPYSSYYPSYYSGYYPSQYGYYGW